MERGGGVEGGICDVDGRAINGRREWIITTKMGVLAFVYGIDS